MMIGSRSLTIHTVACLFAAVLATPCADNLILNHEIKAMQVTTNPLNAKGVTLQVKDPGTIQEVVGKMNCSVQEPAVFYAEYHVRFQYRGGHEVVILVNGKRLKLEGVTYIANEDIGGILSRVIRK